MRAFCRFEHSYLLLVSITLALVGCQGNAQIQGAGGGDSSGGNSSGGNTQSAAGGGGSGGSTAAGSPDSVTIGSSTGSGGDDCPKWEADADFLRDPIDLIVAVDNSATMASEIASLEQHLHSSLVQPLSSYGLTPRVIMLSQHGSSPQQVCVSPPLSGTTNCDGPPVNVPEQFYHYSVNVPSQASLCTMLSTLNGLDADDYNMAPGGWLDWLRPETLKAFVVLTDSGVDCLDANMSLLDDNNTSAGGMLVATDFDQQLLNAAPAHFGIPPERNYVFYGMLGLAPKGANEPQQHYDPQEPITTLTCAATGGAPGTGYQWLSKSSGALRFPACNTGSYPAFLVTLADDLNDQALNRCRFAPPPSDEQAPSEFDVSYYPGDNGPSLGLFLVSTPEACGPGSYYFDGNEWRLCPSMCAVIKADPGARLGLSYQECPPPER